MKRIFATVVIFMISAFMQNASFAAENILNSVLISPNNSSYEIKLDTSKSVKVKYSVNSADKITLFVKNIQLSENFNTIYNGSADINSVILEPAGNNLKINISGHNVSNAIVQNISQTSDNRFVTYLISSQKFIVNPENLMPVYLLFCIGLIFAFVRKIKKDAQIVENSQQREFNLMKSIIENFGELGFVDKSHISLNGNSIAYQKLQTMKKIDKLEKQFSSDNKESDEKFVYKTPARSKLGGMTNVCSKIMSPQIGALERARVINTIKPTQISVSTKN